MVEGIFYDKLKKIYHVKSKQWPVGDKYIIHEHIGNGSYGDVCKSTNKETNEIVALKRIPDILCCPMLAKRVLREVCIMRRLSHPNIIRLCDVFTCNSQESNNAVDLYIATEFADGGDLYHLQKVLNPEYVKNLVFQLLSATQYLHSCQVWHRDIKSENTLLFSNKIVKLCDFGLSRSAYMADSDTFENQNISNRFKKESPNSNVKKLTRQYTKTVVTPSYRAPEVVMSKGQYTSAIDIWSLGCIFWELLMRQMNPRRLGPPNHPLFGVKGEFKTPVKGEKYDGDNPISEHLDVIFDVIGTPCWKDIETVPSEAWKAFLKKLPGRSGNLHSQMMNCRDADAIDLLSRMLAFNPERRCTAEEAMHHAYFRSLNHPSPLYRTNSEETCIESNLPKNVHFWQVTNPAIALGLLEKELDISAQERDGGKKLLQNLLQHEIKGQNIQNNLQLQIFPSPSPSPSPSFSPSPSPSLPHLPPPLDSSLLIDTSQMHNEYFPPQMHSAYANKNQPFYATVREMSLLPPPSHPYPHPHLLPHPLLHPHPHPPHLPPLPGMVFCPRPSVAEIVQLNLSVNRAANGKNSHNENGNNAILTNAMSMYPSLPEPSTEVGKKRKAATATATAVRGRGRGGRGRGRGRGVTSQKEKEKEEEQKETITITSSPEETKMNDGLNYHIRNTTTTNNNNNSHLSNNHLNNLSNFGYGNSSAMNYPQYHQSQTLAESSQMESTLNPFHYSNADAIRDPAQQGLMNTDVYLNTSEQADRDQRFEVHSSQNEAGESQEKVGSSQNVSGNTLHRSFSIRNSNRSMNDDSFSNMNMNMNANANMIMKNNVHQNLILEQVNSVRRSPRLLTMRQNDLGQRRKSNLMG